MKNMLHILCVLVGLANFECMAKKSKYEVDISKKLQECELLVQKAIPFFAKNSIENSCRSFIHDIRWRKGEIGIFIFSSDGVCYVFCQDTEVIWKDFQDKKTTVETEFINAMLETGKLGGFVDYRWNNSNMKAYVKSVKKDGEFYIIGAGFFPTSSEYFTEQMVKRAIQYGTTHDLKDLFATITNPLGMFSMGDIFLYVYDSKGNIVAHGESIELIGQNLLDQTTADGKYRTQDMLKIANSPSGSGWYTYASKQGNAEKKSYIERFVDPKTGNWYAIIGGYYPTIDENSVQSVVKRANHYLRSYGSERSFSEFSKKSGPFAYGSISIFVYTPDGTVVADMANPSFVGLNLINSRDTEGKYITKTILEHAERYPQGGWVSFSLKNSFVMIYVEKISVPDGDFIVGASYYPTSKYIQVRFMTERAATYLKTNPKEEAFNLFSSHDPDFLRGDVYIFVYNKQGVTLVSGYDRSKIWHSNIEFKDDKGKLVTEKIIAIATSGGGWFEFEHDNATRRIYIKQVSKEANSKEETETFIVGSGYYL